MPKFSAVGKLNLGAYSYPKPLQAFAKAFSIVAILPIVMTVIFDLPSSAQIGGTSLIIVVGVAIETAKQIKTTAQEKEYHGFMD